MLLSDEGARETDLHGGLVLADGMDERRENFGHVVPRGESDVSGDQKCDVRVRSQQQLRRRFLCGTNEHAVPLYRDTNRGIDKDRDSDSDSNSDRNTEAAIDTDTDTYRTGDKKQTETDTNTQTQSQTMQHRAYTALLDFCEYRLDELQRHSVVLEDLYDGPRHCLAHRHVSRLQQSRDHHRRGHDELEAMRSTPLSPATVRTQFEL